MSTFKTITLFVLASCAVMSPCFSAVPEFREVNVTSWKGAEFFNIAVSRGNAPVQTKLLAGGSGFEVNTNQDILYQCNGNDFASFINNINRDAMIITMEIPLLPLTAGILEKTADGKKVGIRVSHMKGYSRVDILLSNQYTISPSWQPWERTRRRMEVPFLYKTVESVIEQISPDGQSARFGPNYYTVTYCSGLSLPDIRPEIDVTMQKPRYSAQIVVPLKFEDDSNWGDEIKSGRFGGMDYMMIATRKGGSPAVKAYVGAFGLRIDAKREFLFQGGGTFVDKAKYYQKGPMMVSMTTKKRIATAEGIHRMTADYQDLEYRVSHAENRSHLLVRLPAQYNRGPYWLPKAWGGGKVSSYPGFDRETQLCGETVSAFLKALGADHAESRPDYYQVNYTNGNDSLSIDPSNDITLERNVPIWVGVPCKGQSAQLADRIPVSDQTFPRSTEGRMLNNTRFDILGRKVPGLPTAEISAQGGFFAPTPQGISKGIYFGATRKKVVF